LLALVTLAVKTYIEWRASQVAPEEKTS
jgi:hypothetical protein